MSVAITVSHIFVNGRELGLFYKKFRKILISQSRANLFLIIQKNKGKDFIQNQYQLF